MLGCVPASFMLLLMCFMPETPRFLLTQHRRQEAMAAMQFLWGSEQVWEEPPVSPEHQVRDQEPEPGWAANSEIWPLCSQGRLAQPVPKAAQTHTGKGSTSGGIVLSVSKQRPATWLGPSLDLTVPGRERPSWADLRNGIFKWDAVGQWRRPSLCHLLAL